MADRLPPLNALRAFDAAARHLSLAGAAEELHVTPAAISQQIKTLEEHLGMKVFLRLPRGLALTPEAERCLPTLQRGFSQLQEATRQLRAPLEKDKLALWTAPAFAAKWLMPRLNQFNRIHPSVDMDIHASNSMMERQRGNSHAIDQIRRSQIDVAIVFGQGHYPGCRVDKLFNVHAVPLCSPTLRSANPPLLSAEDLRFHHLLHDDTDYDAKHGWKDWYEKAQMDSKSWERGTHFNQVQLALEAAIERQGVLLSLDLMAQRDISAGRLCIPFGPALPLDNSYFLVRPQYQQHEATESFCEWILDQAHLSEKSQLPVAN